MEKMAELEDGMLYRLQCDCSDPMHCLDFEFGRAGAILTFWNNYRTMGLRERIKRAAKAVLGKDYATHDFCIRDGDISFLVEALNKYRESEHFAG